MEIRHRPSFLQRLSVPILGFLLILPLFFFKGVLENLIIEEEKQLVAFGKSRLMVEAEAFQSDLNPKRFIENAFRQLNTAFELSPPQGGKALYRYPDNYDPDLIKNDFLASASLWLENNFSLRPTIFLAGNCDLQNIYSYFGHDFFPDSETQQIFAESILLHYASVESEAANILPDTRDLEQRCKQNAKKLNVSSPFLSLDKLFLTFISFFSSPPIYTDVCKKIFSTRLNDQRIYSYAYSAKKLFPDNTIGTYGLYYVLVKGENINEKSVIDDAVCRSKYGVKRLFLEKKVLKPGFSRNDKGMFFSTSLSSVFFQILQDNSKSLDNRSRKAQKFYQNCSLATFLPDSELTSSQRPVLTWLKLIIKFAIIMVLAVSAFFFFKIQVYDISLLTKLKTAIFFLMIIPVTGVFFVGKAVETSGLSKSLAMLNAKVTKGLAELEHFEIESEVKSALKFFQQKLMMSEHFKTYPPNVKPVKKFMKNNENETIFGWKHVLYRNGEGINFDNKFIKARKDNKYERIGLYKILQEMGIVETNSPLIKKLEKEKFFVSSYAGSYWDSQAFADTIAKEGQIIEDIFSVSSLRKICIQLLSAPDAPLTPYALVYNEYHELQNLYKLLNYLNRTWNNRVALPNGQIEYAIFLRHTFDLRNKSWPLVIAGTNSLRKQARQSISKRSSGKVTTREGNRLMLTSWIYKDTSPMIYVAQAYIDAPGKIDFRLRLIPWLFLIYSMLATLLISEGLSSLVIVPVRAMIRGIDQIRKGNYVFRLKLDCNDEFSHLEKTFNEMTTGLLQRKKMKRFVSEKLIENLDINSSEKSVTKVENIVLLSSDIRDFTTISEKNTPEAVVTLLNDYLTCMQTAIYKQTGEVEKIVGDAIQASFSDSSDEENAINACLSAFEMRKQLKRLNKRRLANNLFPIENGIGISYGTVVSGCAGLNSQRKEFIMVGKVFARSEKLEAASKMGIESKIIIDETIEPFVRNKFDMREFEVDKETLWELKNHDPE
jgi:class 3 adenylate cyclase